MNVVLILFVLPCLYASDFSETLGHIKPSASAAVQENAVADLIKRILPNFSDRFKLSVQPIGPEGKDTYHLSSKNGTTVEIIGTSAVAIATGFHYYIKYVCERQISWEVRQISIPDLPNSTIDITTTLHDRFRYFQNVCTSSYSFVWWNWEQWEQHIDWLALNSFNLVLAIDGQEALWRRVYEQLHMTDTEIDEHFAGPAFLAWNRMGNLRGWGGPLSQAWHNRTLILQKKIVQRLRELGIITVLPAFAGHVPRAFKRLYPTTKLYPMQKWNHFNDTYCCPYLLDPTENLFADIGKLFLNEVIKEFGTDHVYSCDTFNEMTPFTSNTSYLKSIGESIYSTMTKVDPKAIWLLQGWTFHHEKSFWTNDLVKNFIGSVPLGKMIVLDLQSEQFPQYDRLESYFGQPYIWCMLHNFGGTLGMFGSSDIINERTFEARSQNGSTMIGLGMTPEGINQNYVIYDLMSEMAWRTKPVDLQSWFSNYTVRRYGVDNASAKKAWEMLRKTVYSFNSLMLMRGKFAYNSSPRTTIRTWTWYDPCVLNEAWPILREANILNSSAWQYDMTDLTRQMVQVNGDDWYNKIVSSFKNKNIFDFQEAVENFLQAFIWADGILSRNEHFLLGKWLAAAKQAAGDNEKEQALFEYNARNQITLWGPKGEIKDYANKQWSGIVSNYFEPRWRLFIKYMNDSLVNGTPFRESQVRQRVFKEVEEPFTFDRTSFPERPAGDAIEYIDRIYVSRSLQLQQCEVQRSRKLLNFVTSRHLEPKVVIID